MFWTITAILLVLWVLGMVSGASVGMWIHLLLAFSLVSLLLAVMGAARRPLQAPPQQRRR